MSALVLTWAVAAIAMQEAPAAAQPAKPASPPASKPAPPASETSTTVTGVTVTTTRPQVQTQIDRRSYSVANDLQAQTGNIGDALRNIPSVQVDLNGNLSLRGDSNVTVLLDGQPSSQFSADNLAQALQSLPANRIDKIEVITNPSAAFRADGSGGIINLISKKVTTQGPTGSVQVMAGHDGRARVAISGSKGGPRLRVNGDIAVAHLVQNADQENRSSQFNGAGQTISRSREVVSEEAPFDLVNAHAGVEYDIDKRTRWSGDLRGNYGKRNLNGDGRFVAQDANNAPVFDFDRNYGVDIEPFSLQAATRWQRRYGEGHDLTFSGVFDRLQNDNDRTQSVVTQVPTGVAPQASRLTYHSVIYQNNLKADYNRPLVGKSKLQLGYEMFYADGVLVNDVGQTIGSGPAPLDPALHDKFDAQAMINDLYATYERPFGKVTALGGVRAETVNINLTRVTQSVDYDQYYAHLYPTLHLSYDVGEGKRLTASYSKRVNRPFFVDVNPYRQSGSPQQSFQGNPNLKPELTDSYEVGFERRQGPSILLATLYYRSTTDAITTIATDLGDGVLLAQRANAGERQNAGLELVKTGKLNAKLTYNLSANLYWSRIQSPNLGFNTDRSGTTGFGRANLNWQVTPKDFVQLNLFANGKAFYPQGYGAPNASGNIGWRHKVNDQLSWMVVAQDPFDTLRNRLVLDQPNGQIVRRAKFNSQIFTFTIVKNFGGGRTRDPNFDFVPGGGAGAGPL